MTRIAATADFHGTFPRPEEIPTCDILVVAGDIGASLEMVEGWLKEIHVPEVVAVLGNVDWSLAQNSWLPEWTMLNDEAVVIAGVKFYGSEGTNINDAWSASGIPADTEVLVTHVPPYGILDEVMPGEHIGSKFLRGEVFDGTAESLALHLFGHCHEQAGKRHQERGITFANVGYLGVRLPQVFEI